MDPSLHGFLVTTAEHGRAKVVVRRVAVLRGFVVFRSTGEGPYRQVSPILAANTFTDPTARRGVEYRYCVQSVDPSGLLSLPSIPVFYSY